MVPWSKADGHQGGVGAAGWCLHRLPHSMWGRAKRLPVGLVAAPCAEQERQVAASRCSRKDGGQCSGLPTQTACARCARRVGEPEHRQEHSSTPFSIYTIHERQTRQTKTYDPVVEKESCQRGRTSERCSSDSSRGTEQIIHQRGVSTMRKLAAPLTDVCPRRAPAELYNAQTGCATHRRAPTSSVCRAESSGLQKTSSAALEEQQESTPGSPRVRSRRQEHLRVKHVPMRMLLTGIWRSRTKYPMKPITANPIAVADAILVNSVSTGARWQRPGAAQQRTRAGSQDANTWTWHM